MMIVPDIQVKVSRSVRAALKVFKEMEIPEEKAKELIFHAVEVGFWNEEELIEKTRKAEKELIDLMFDAVSELKEQEKENE